MTVAAASTLSSATLILSNTSNTQSYTHATIAGFASGPAYARLFVIVFPPAPSLRPSKNQRARLRRQRRLTRDNAREKRALQREFLDARGGKVGCDHGRRGEVAGEEASGILGPAVGFHGGDGVVVDVEGWPGEVTVGCWDEVEFGDEGATGDVVELFG